MTRLPMVGLETDIAEIIERHLDVSVDMDGYGNPYSMVDGVENAALAIVDDLRRRGIRTE